MTLAQQAAAGRGFPRRQGGKFSGRALLVLLVVLALQVWFLQPATAAEPPGELLENLQYRVNAFLCGGAARAGMVLKSLGSGRFQAELSVEYQGIFGVVTGNRRDHFQTEMIYRDGQLAPLVYREESRWRKKYRLKEYRFDYAQGRLELWTYHKGKGILRQWETALQEKPFCDPLSAFYNLRLGGLGPRKEGETIKIAGIPYPRPEEIVIRIGPQAKEGRKVEISFVNQAFKDQQGKIMVFFDEKWTPVQAETKVLSFGKVVGEILPQSKPLTGGLPAMVAAPGAKGPGD